MTTLLHKKNAYKKARAISSGFWELINTFVLTPQQGLAGKLTSFRSVMKHHKNNDSTSVIDITCSQARKPMTVWPRGSEGFQVVRSTIPEIYGPLIDGGLNSEH